MGRIFDFIANSGDGVFAVDRRQSIVLWNKRATEILGFTSEEVQGKKCFGIVCGRDARDCMVCRRGCRAIAEAKRLQPAPTRDIAVRTKGGIDAWLNLSTVVVPSRRQDLSVLIHLFREVTRHHDLQSAAQDFVETVSHGPSKKKVRSIKRETYPANLSDLTHREREVLACLASGISTDLISDKLCISPRTVGNHVNNILRKLGVHSRLEAVTCSIKNGSV